MFNKILPMTGVELQTSGIESDRSTNWATTTSQQSILIVKVAVTKYFPKVDQKVASEGLLKKGP